MQLRKIVAIGLVLVYLIQHGLVIETFAREIKEMGIDYEDGERWCQGNVVNMCANGQIESVSCSNGCQYLCSAGANLYQNLEKDCQSPSSSWMAIASCFNNMSLPNCDKCQNGIHCLKYLRVE